MARWGLAARVLPRRRSSCSCGFGFLEGLESRLLLSHNPVGYTPYQIRHAYGFDSVSFGSITGDGSGQTIAIVTAYDAPTIATDLHGFDYEFGLPDPAKSDFIVVAQDGSKTLPPTDPVGPGHGDSWASETSMDVEWAHALAPGAKILLVEANSDSTDDLVAAVDFARHYAGVSVVSMSWSIPEFAYQTGYDQYFTTPAKHDGVTFIAAAGDDGKEAIYPAASPNVLAVGGTTLVLASGSQYGSETGWGNGNQSSTLGGSGGGISRYEAQPAYQKGVVTQSTSKRTVPDVAFYADPGTDDNPTGVAVYDSWDASSPFSPWLDPAAGTSLGAPAWAAVIAIADQGRALGGLDSLDGRSETLPMLYALPDSDFHDIITGNNGYAAGPGYDLVTGLGTPVVDPLVRNLVPPVADDDLVTVIDAAGPQFIDVLANDTDYNVPLTITGVGSGSHGTVSLSGGQIYYSLTDLSAFTDSFTYTVTGNFGQTSTATVNVLVGRDDPDVTIGQGQVAQSLVYTDSDGTTVTVSISRGTATLHLTGLSLGLPGTKVITIHGSAALGGVTIDSATASSVTITPKGGVDATATLGGIDGSAIVGSLKASGIHLIDQGIVMSGSGYIGSITLGDIDADVTMTAGPKGGVKIVAGRINAGQITLDAGLATLTALQWDSGSLLVPWAGTISITGSKTRPLPGNLGAELTFTTGSARPVVLSSLKVSGAVDALVSAAQGKIKGIVVGSWGGGSLDAASLGGLVSKAAFAPALTLTGPIGSKAKTLGSANIAGAVSGQWIVTGSTGSLLLGSSLTGWNRASQAAWPKWW